MMSPPHSLPMQPFWPEGGGDGGGPDGEGGPAAESPVRTVAIALVTVRPNREENGCRALPAAAQAAFPQTYGFGPSQFASAQFIPPRHASAQSSPAPASWSQLAAPLAHEFGSPAAHSV